jgi:Xaa-Pro aminopeptidase
MDYLDDLITRCGATAYCLYASSDEPDMRYLTRFVTHDPVPVIKRAGETPVMIVPLMEAARAERESTAQVMTRQQAGYQEIIRDEKDPYGITAAMIHRYVQGSVVVPPWFPLGLARALERENQVILDDSATIARMRSVKKPEEISHIQRAQLAVEMAMKEAINLIQKSEVKGGTLWHNERPLTSEYVRFTIQATLLNQNFSARDTIVACGEDTALPHCVGSGPLQSNQPIIIDIFPQCQETGYHADMTRTVSKGTPSSAVCDLYGAVSEAQTLGEKIIAAGVSGATCYQKVRDYFDERGFISDTEGFTHSLGHGIGLEVHERPSLSPAGDTLQEGQVVTIEPGLYYRGIGGVRIENLGIVTNTGFNCFTNFSNEMIL